MPFLMAMDIIFFSFLFSVGRAENIDFSRRITKEPIDFKFWQSHPHPGINVNNGRRTVIFKQPTNFWKTVFDSQAVFVSATFDSFANFEGATFRSLATFNGATFKSIANFRYDTFYTSAGFGRAIFHSKTDFSESRFKSSASFERTTYHSMVHFWRTEFDSSARFLDDTFNDTVRFEETTFHSDTYFTRTVINSAIFFDSTTFDSVVDFSKARFGPNSIATFNRTIFGSTVDFTNTILPPALDFRYVAHIAREIDFTLAKPPLNGDKCLLALFGTDISKFKLNMLLFKLWFRADTSKHKLSDEKDAIVIDSLNDDQKSSIYETVLRKLKEDGLMESYQILDIEYRKFKYGLNGWTGWIANKWQSFWWNYGYNKGLIFRGTFILFGLSLLFTLFYLTKLNQDVYKVGFLDTMQVSDMSKIKRGMFYFFHSVTYTAFIFFGVKMGLEDFQPGVVRKHPILFLGLMIMFVAGIVCLGFMINYIFTL